MSALPGSIPFSSLGALTEAASAINSTLNLDSVLSTIARLACDVTQAEVASVFLLDARRTVLKAVAATGDRRDALVGRKFDARGGVPGEVVRTGQAMLVLDVMGCRSYRREIDDLSSMRTRSLIAVPMIHRGEVIGVIEVVNRRDEGEFTDRHVNVLQVFSTLAASATRNASEHRDLQDQLADLRESVVGRTSLIGQSDAWQHVLRLVDRVGRSNASVLILGETGTGKELIARHIHTKSKRRGEAFVAVNCGAVTETLLESDLFGHEKGAFTGAHARRRGWFEVAHKGTLFLDEIGDVPRSMQVKLLRVLQDGCIVRVGGGTPIECDVRIIAATNRNLKNMVIDGLFREDLYYRLNVFPIELPPLRERKADIPLFVEHVVDRARRECGIEEMRIAPETMDILTRYTWPGNVRELHNVIERSVLMSDGSMLHPSHLPSDISVATDAEAVRDETTLHGQERALIVKALNDHGWNQCEAARSLGVTRYHVRHRMKKYAIAKNTDGAGAGP